MEKVSEQRLNLDRQSFLGEHSSQVLQKTRVAIVGLGGGGSHIAQQLAHVGVGEFLLLDPDTIEDTNLNRLVGARFTDIEEKTSKVEIAKRLIESVNPTAKVIPAASSWEEQALDLQDCEVIFGCIDSLIGRSELEAFARRYGAEVRAVKYTVNTTAGDLTPSRPGGTLWQRVTEPFIRIVLSYTSAYDSFAKEAMKSKLNIGWVSTNADTSHSTLNQSGGRDYASNGWPPAMTERARPRARHR